MIVRGQGVDELSESGHDQLQFAEKRIDIRSSLSVGILQLLHYVNAWEKEDFNPSYKSACIDIGNRNESIIIKYVQVSNGIFSTLSSYLSNKIREAKLEIC